MSNTLGHGLEDGELRSQGDRAGDLIGLPDPAKERYMGRAELADSLDIHVKTLDRLRHEPGFPEENWGLSTPRFLRSRVVAWLRQREARRAA